MSYGAPMGGETIDEVDERLIANSLINASTVVDGTIVTETDLRIDGHITGSIQCKGTLHVARGSVVDATVEAGGIIVEGRLSGSIQCHGRLEIRPSGTVSGEVETGRLVILEGAIYEGRLRMERVQPTAGDELESSGTSLGSAASSTSNPYAYFRSSGSGSPQSMAADEGSSDDEDDDDSK